MHSLIDKLSEYRIFRQFASSTILTILNVLASFAAIPLFVNTLGQENYGIWLAMFSIITWASIMDVGISSGLRNLLSEAIKRDLKRDIGSLLTTSIYSISSILMAVFILILLFTEFVEIDFLFPNHKGENLTVPFLFAIASFLLIVQGKIMHSAAAAYHFSEVSALVNVIQNISICVILFFIGIWGLEAPLQVFTLSFFLLTFILYTLPLILFAVANSGLEVLSVFNFSASNFSKIVELGRKFFILQISAAILYSTDTFLLQYFFSPKVAAEYGIILKYYGILVLAVGIIGAPVWSATATDIQSEDKYFLNLLRQNSHFLFLFIIAASLVMLALQDSIFNIWVPNLSISGKSFALWIMVYSIMQCTLFWFGSIINGSGFLFLLTISAPFAAVSNLLICIVGIRYFGQGVNWIVLSTIISNFPSLIISGVQAYKILNNQHKGLWAK